MANDEDEKVDGAKIAAQILNRMKPASKDRIVKEIQEKDPQIAQRIEENLFDFDDLADLTSQGVQLLLNAIEHKDLVISLKTASAKVKDILFANMSERKKKITEEDFQALTAVRINEVQEAQQRILKKLDELRTSGQIRTKGKHDAWV